VARDPPGNDLAPLGHEVLERRLVLEVDLGVLVGAVAADLSATEGATTAPLVVLALAPRAAVVLVATSAAALAFCPLAHGYSSPESSKPPSKPPSSPRKESRSAPPSGLLSS